MKNLIYLIIFPLFTGFLISCESTNSITKNSGIELDNFNFQDIVIKGKGEIVLSITQSDHDYLEIDATEEQVDLLDVSINKNKLTITGDKELAYISRRIYVDVKIRDLNSINIRKGNNQNIKANHNEVIVDFTNEISGDTLIIYGEGKNEIAGRLNYKYLKIHHQGIISCELEGASDYLDMHLEGIAKVAAKNLIVKDGDVRAEGISKINVNMLNDADINAEGIHLIKYNDNPNINFRREGIVLRNID